MNPNAPTFVPRFSTQQAPPQPTPSPMEDTTSSTQPAPASVDSWEEVAEPAPSTSNTAATNSFMFAPAQEDAPPKPTESVFTVSEDDLEPADDEEVAAELKKMEVSPLPANVEDHREHLNIVFIGHVDAGKSTISGQIMLQTGQVDERTLQKYEKEAVEKNRESWFLAYIMDTNEEERLKGKTVEVGRAHFETDKKRYTVLDAPGHKNYVPNMIGGAAQADVAILVISARKGEFETGFEKGGQTREHARLVKTIGVKYLIVVINKMDDSTVNWSKERFDECVSKLTPFLRQTGFNPKTDLQFLPVSGFTGANIVKPSSKEACPWFEGPTLLGALDNLPPLERKADAPLRVPVVDSFKDRGLTIIMGKIEAGTVSTGQTVYLMPGKVPLEVVGISTDTTTLKTAKAGENVRLSVRGIEEGNVSSGFVVCDNNLVPTVTEFEVMMAILELPKEKSLLTAGYEAVLHIHTAVEDCTVSELLAQIDPKTNQEIKGKKPTFVKSGSAVRCRLQVPKPISMEDFKTLPQLGRFTLRDGGRSIAMGKVLSVGPKKAK
jgi:peptide chain release factor subunit 3